MTNKQSDQAIIERLDRIEAENAALKNEIAAFRAERAKVPTVAKVFTEPQVHVSNPMPPAPIALPNRDEVARLMEIVWRRHPGLRPTYRGRFSEQDEEEGIRNVEAAFTYVSTLKRVRALNNKVFLSWWGSRCDDWWQGYGRSRTIPGGAVLIAAICSGDVGYRIDSHHFTSSEIALGEFDGAPATEAWKDVLRTGEVRSPVLIEEKFERIVVGAAGGQAPW